MRTRLALALLVTTPAWVACGADDRPVVADEAPVADLDTADATAGPTGEPTSEATTDPTSEPTVDLGDAELVTLTGAELCEALSVDDATLAIGTEVSQAEASDLDTPQCTYTYGGDSSTLSTFTVAAQRPEDVGGRGLGEAFDYVLELNRSLAVGTTVVEEEVPVGERTVRLGGDTLTLSVVASGGRLLTIITTPDLDTEAVDALSAAAADAVE